MTSVVQFPVRSAPEMKLEVAERSDAAVAPLPRGVSVVLCCHNSEVRLPQTLAHLAAQTGVEGSPWEIVIVDNASKDNTAEVAHAAWPASCPVPLRVVSEGTPGLTNARLRGLKESRYEFVSFIDDDNWVAPDWVARVFAVLRDHSEVGACGGNGSPVFEQTPPEWFDKFSSNYAVGQQGRAEGYVSVDRGYLFGAGLTIRRVAWLAMISGGYRSVLADRTGSALSSGGDTELCLALQIAGWKLWYDPNLKFQHFMPAGRLEWQYLRKLKRAFGESQVWLEIYREILQPPALMSFNLMPLPPPVCAAIRRTWFFRAYTMIRSLLSADLKLWKRRNDPELEGTPEILELEWQVGRALGLVRAAFIYDWRVFRLRSGGWLRARAEAELALRDPRRSLP